jgi:citrate lyase subunit beta / citryl-CoA lyase
VSAPIRSWLYVPAVRAELLPKAIAGEADAVIVDLEDAVPADDKSRARDAAADLLSEPFDKPVWVRTNDPLGPWGRQDLEVIAGLPVAGVRLPKCVDPGAVAEAGRVVGKPLQLMLESARGVHRVDELIAASPLVAGIGLGEADLLADLRGFDESALEWSRGQVVVAARAAGLPSPPQSVWTDIEDIEGLRVTTHAARAKGFFGRSVLHPRQVPVVNDVFTPTPDEIEQARRVAGAMREAGSNTVVDERGRFIDPAVVAGAEFVLALADALSAKENR